MSELENTQQDTEKREERNDGFEPPAVDRSRGVAEGEQDGSVSTDLELESVQNGQTGAANAARTVSALFSEGMASMKEVNAAHRAHTEARNELDRLDATIESRKLDLDHRRDVESRYDEIIRSETERKNCAEQEREKAEQRRAEIDSSVDELKKQLDTMRDQDATTERRLKSALEAAEDKERSSRESGRRLQRRLDDAQANLEHTMKEREEGVAAAEQAVKSAEAHLSTLNTEYADIQRNPSANPAGYSVRKRELEIEISDAAEALRNARGDVPRIEGEMHAAIEEARASVREAERPIAQAKEAFNAIVAEADRARDVYSEAKEDAEKRQKDLRSKISEHEKEAREQERAAQNAQQDADAAQDALDEANDIHAHPEATIALANALEADRAEREERMREVEELAAAEKTVRERTRGARLRLVLAIAGIVLVAGLMIAWTYVAK